MKTYFAILICLLVSPVLTHAADHAPAAQIPGATAPAVAIAVTEARPGFTKKAHKSKKQAKKAAQKAVRTVLPAAE